MDVKQAIAERRSVRKYQQKEVPEDVIMELMESARLAPSGNNAQPWRYKIITSAGEKALLKENEIFKQDFVYTAPVIIICCGDPSVFPGGEFIPGIDDPNDIRAIRDLAISSQNLVLRAQELGLGTCYIGWMNKPKAASLLGIPDNFKLPYAITVGYPAESPSERPRHSIKEILLK